jgi:cellulose synthase (UDP-forming)
MTISKVKQPEVKQPEVQPPEGKPPTRQRSRRRSPRWPPTATRVMIVGVMLTAGISSAWLAHEPTLVRFFGHLHQFQEAPPGWLEVPMVAGSDLVAPTVILGLIAWLIMKLSPTPRPWSRRIVVTILLVLTVRYLLWRSLTTLNLADATSGVVSVGLLGLEWVMLGSGIIQLVLMFQVRDRRQQADAGAIAVQSGQFNPTVDIFIPTYNEPDFILRRTIIGCQALDYGNQRLYLLDDTHRPEIAALAADLGCEYRTRPDNRHAKAGNLNAAIAQTDGELIVVFDADFVPTSNFLTRTVGFFQDNQIALVQTPQSFYNSDPIARNLGLENILTSEEEVFYRQIQPIRDGAGSVICAGTSFVVRRQALAAAGGFVTDSLSEDYFTGIRLSAQGYQLVYLDEKLSAGLAAEDMAAYASQRLRWARGTLQAFFIAANPLTIPGLTPWQRLAHLEGLLHWFTSLSRIGYLLAPLLYSAGIIPIRATAHETLYFFLPYYMVQLTVFAWLNHRSRSAILSDIYSLVLTFPLALTVLQVFLNPFSTGFQVTPKGGARDRFSFNWRLAFPLMGLFGITAISLWHNLGLAIMQGPWLTPVSPAMDTPIEGIGLGWLWSLYNLVMLGIALLILLDVPKPDRHDWFDLRRTVWLRIDAPEEEETVPMAGSIEPRPRRQFLGMTTMLSEGGAAVQLTQAGFPALARGAELPVTLEILEEALPLTGVVTQVGMDGGFPTVRVRFQAMDLPQQRRLVEMLFCRPGQWQRYNSPGELRSLWLLVRILLKPRFLFDRGADVRAIALAKV